MTQSPSKIDVQDAWIVGAEVVEQSNSIYGVRYGARHRIAKVYKNGNVVLDDGSQQQWRPWKERASKTGDSGWRPSSTSILLLTPEVKADMATAIRLQAAKKLVEQERDRLDHVAKSRDDDLILATAATLKALQAQGETE